MNEDIFIVNEYYVYYYVEKIENESIRTITQIGSNSVTIQLPVMGEKLDININDIGYPKSGLFYQKLNKLNLIPGTYILEMKCIRAGLAGLIKDFYEGVAIYKKAKFHKKEIKEDRKNRNFYLSN